MRHLLATLLMLAAASTARAEGTAPDAKAIYARRCAGCHGGDGRGDTKPGKKYKIANLSDPSWPLAWDRVKIRKVIAEGVPGQMPAWSDKLTAQEIDAVAGHLLGLSATK
jgi:mono/diheme cytochrome c family protein